MRTCRSSHIVDASVEPLRAELGVCEAAHPVLADVVGPVLSTGQGRWPWIFQGLDDVDPTVSSIGGNACVFV